MKQIQDYLEATELKSTLTGKEVDQLCTFAKEHQLKGVCLPPFWVKKAARELKGSEVVLVTVIGFPLGYQMTQVKLSEMEWAIKDGAQELDLVWNVSAFKDGMPWPKIELAQCAKLAHDHQCFLKVILETALLNEEEIKRACKICADAGVDYVKTSTGFSSRGASIEDIQLMRAALPASVGIKASGGIKTLVQCQTLLEAGADRIGSSQYRSIVKESQL